MCVSKRAAKTYFFFFFPAFFFFAFFAFLAMLPSVIPQLVQCKSRIDMHECKSTPQLQN
jgi:hypothetical protein